MSIDGVLYSNPLQIASHFNEFFTNVANTIVETIHPVDNEFSPSPPQMDFPSFNFESIPLTHTEVIESIYQLQNKNTLDFEGISSNFIKKIATPILYPLYLIFKNSFSSGTVICPYSDIYFAKNN